MTPIYQAAVSPQIPRSKAAPLMQAATASLLQFCLQVTNHSCCVWHSGIAAGSSRKLLQDSCAAEYAQCGGITCPTGSCPSSSDTEWTCCPSGNSCQRQNQWYWQCLPISGSSTTLSTAQAPSVAAPAAVNLLPISTSTSEGTVITCKTNV